MGDWVPIVLCIVYMCVFLCGLVYTHRRWQGQGRMRWQDLKWEHCARGHGLSSRTMAVYRLCFSVGVLLGVGGAASEDPKDSGDGRPALGGPQVLATVTVWSFALIGVYQFIAGVVSAADARGIIGFEGQSSEDSKASRRWRNLCCFQWALFETMLSVALLVTTLVWCVLLPFAFATLGDDGGLFSWEALSAHNLNIVFMVIDARLNGLWFNPAHVVYCFYYGSSYIVFSWFWFVVDDKFYYFFIDFRDMWTLLGYTACIAIMFGCFKVGACFNTWIKPATDVRAPTSSSAGQPLTQSTSLQAA